MRGEITCSSLMAFSKWECKTNIYMYYIILFTHFYFMSKFSCCSLFTPIIKVLSVITSLKHSWELLCDHFKSRSVFNWFGREFCCCGMNDELFFRSGIDASVWTCLWCGINVMLISKTQVILLHWCNLDNSSSGVNLLMFITPRASDADCEEISGACCYVMFLSSAWTFLCTL